MNDRLERPDPPYETRDVNLRWLFLSIVVLAALCVAALLLASGTFFALETTEDASQRALHPMAERDGPVPGPQLQANPPRELARFLREQRERSESYGWLDPEAGLVRLPVERALELVLQEGLPSREPEAPEQDR